MKKVLINRRWFIFVSSFLILILCGVLSINENVILLVAMIIVGSTLTIGYALIIPHRFVFEEEGITVHYCFGIKTYAKWNELKHIDDKSSEHLWLREYHVGYFNTIIIFLTEATIPKNKRSAMLIEKFYHKKIEKYG